MGKIRNPYGYARPRRMWLLATAYYQYRTFYTFCQADSGVSHLLVFVKDFGYFG